MCGNRDKKETGKAISFSVLTTRSSSPFLFSFFSVGGAAEGKLLALPPKKVCYHVSLCMHFSFIFKAEEEEEGRKQIEEIFIYYV